MLLHDRICREARRLRFLALDHSTWNANHGRPGCNFLHDDGVRADARALADGEAAEDLGTCTDNHARAKRRMAFLTAIERRAAERHALVNRAAVADLRRLADNDAHAVIDEHARANLRAGMDLDAG